MDTSVDDVSRTAVREAEPDTRDPAGPTNRPSQGRARPFLTRSSAADQDSARRNAGRELLRLAFFLAAGLVVLSPVIGHAGWPANHETGSLFARTEIYAEHLRHWDLLP